MDSNELPADAEACRRLQASILASFNEIAQTYLNAMRGKRVTAEIFASLQKYLDGTAVIHGTRFRRRGVLLAVHDIREKIEAPVTLQRTTKTQSMSLKMQPLPEIKYCSDVATAILRIEVVIRQAANQAPQAQERQPLPSLLTMAQQFDYPPRLHVWLAAAMPDSKSLCAVPRAYFAPRSLQLRRLAASLTAPIWQTAWQAPAAQHNIGLPSA